jgi:hypothetical protein
LHASGVGGVDDENVDALLQHVLDIAQLLGHVMPGIGDQQLGAQAVAGVLQGILHGDEVRVVDFLEGHTDLERRGLAGIGGLGAGDGGAGNGESEGADSGAKALAEADCHGEDPVVFIFERKCHR